MCCIINGMNIKRHGFTLVEIMIVIAVVAVLATISVVTYGNVTGRAQSTAYSSAADQFEKLLRIEFARTQKIPYAQAPGGGIFERERTCLAKDANSLPETTEFPAGVCWIGSASDGSISPDYISYNPTLANQFSAAMKGDLPKNELTTASFTYKIRSNVDYTIKTRGIIYMAEYHSGSCTGEGCATVGNGPMYAVLEWISPQKNSCGRGLDTITGDAQTRESMRQAVESWEEALEGGDLSEEDRENIVHAIAQYKSLLEPSTVVCSRMYSPDDTGKDRW